MPHLHSGLYAITDPELLPGEHLISSVKAALEGGCKVVQYRDKLSSPSDKLEYARQLRLLCEHYNAQLIINDNVALCLASDAHGVHLGRSDGDIQQARDILGHERLIGVTCHDDLAYARQCIALGVDYCAFGRMFPSLTKPGAPPCSLKILNEACSLPIPIVAIGGINLDNLAELLQTPIHAAAVIHALFSSRDIRSTATQFQTLFTHRLQV